MVEHRRDSSDAYGQGKKVPMQLRELIAHLQKGDSNLYMSTQEVGEVPAGLLVPAGMPATAAAATGPLAAPVCTSSHRQSATALLLLLVSVSWL